MGNFVKAAWHFVGNRLRDGAPIPKDGEKLVYPGQPILCHRGLHASLQPFDALRFAPGNTLCLVECGGVVHIGAGKLVCTERTILARMDAEPLLRQFARAQALSVAHLWSPPKVVLDYLMVGGSELAALSASAASAWSAARLAEPDTWSSSAARFAALSASEAAAWSSSTAGTATLSAANSAANSAAWSSSPSSTSTSTSVDWLAEKSAAWLAAGQEFDEAVTAAFEDWL